jgi:hypothetical protein
MFYNIGPRCKLVVLFHLFFIHKEDNAQHTPFPGISSANYRFVSIQNFAFSLLHTPGGSHGGEASLQVSN